MKWRYQKSRELKNFYKRSVHLKVYKKHSVWFEPRIDDIRMVLELPTTTASTRLELIGLLFSVLPKKNGTLIAMCFASIFSFVSAALLAIAFSTDNWQNIAFKTPVQTEVSVSIFHSPINFELR